MRNENLIAIGTVTKKHGLTGELIVNLKFSDIATLEDLGVVWLGDAPDRTYPWDVESIRFESKRFFLKLRNVNTTEEADFLKGIQVFIPQDKFSGPDYLTIAGYRMCHALTGKSYGKIIEISGTDKNPLLAIGSERGDMLLIPALGPFIKKVDHRQKMVLVIPPEGLLEE